MPIDRYLNLSWDYKKHGVYGLMGKVQVIVHRYPGTLNLKKILPGRRPFRFLGNSEDKGGSFAKGALDFNRPPVRFYNMFDNG